MPASPPAHEPSAERPGRPRWSASEAARRCGVGRATIQRALADDRIPGAIDTDKGWSIPIEGLLAAGFTPDRPAPASAQPARAAREHARAPSGTDSEHAHRIAELEAELTAERARADLEHAHRIAAESLAIERAERVADLRLVLRQLTAAPADQPTPTPATPPVAPAHPPPPRRSGLLGRILGRRQ